MAHGETAGRKAWENLTQYHATPEYWYFNS